MKIANIPERFRPSAPLTYPMHQKSKRMEERVYDHFKENSEAFEINQVYLPVFWDNYHVRNDFGKDRAALKDLEEVVKKECEKYPKVWTVCDYADGLVIDAPSNLHVFYSACEGGTTIPLLCESHNIEPKFGERNYLASFVGNLDTHPCRREMQKELSKYDNILIVENGGIEAFEAAMRDSYFALCPRGYGPTSYRLYEAMEFGTIPIYISDVHLICEEFDEYILPVKIDFENIYEDLPRFMEGSIREIKKIIGIKEYQKFIVGAKPKYEQVFKYIEHVLKGRDCNG